MGNGEVLCWPGGDLVGVLVLLHVFLLFDGMLGVVWRNKGRLLYVLQLWGGGIMSIGYGVL